MFITKELSCLNNYAAAHADSSYLLVYASSTTVTAGAPGPADGISTFYITNGFHKFGTSYDSNAYTFIRVADPLATGGGCWNRVSDSTFTVQECDSSWNQTLYVSKFFQNSLPFEFLVAYQIIYSSIVQRVQRQSQALAGFGHITT